MTPVRIAALSNITKSMALEIARGLLPPKEAAHRIAKIRISEAEAIWLALEIASYLPDSVESEFRDAFLALADE